jgi:hypothetical protein
MSMLFAAPLVIAWFAVGIPTSQWLFRKACAWGEM